MKDYIFLQKFSLEVKKDMKKESKEVIK